MEKVVINSQIEVTKVSSDAFKYFTGFALTKACSGKMEGLWAFNTSALVNPRCQALSKNPNLICSKCYAQQFLGYRKSCANRYELNYEAANKEVWQYVPNLDEEMGYIKEPVARHEEFGDLGSVTQAVNYLMVVLANPTVKFGWWSKHMDLVAQAFRMLGIAENDCPKNLSIVASSRRLNEVDSLYKKYPFVSHVFTVYTVDYLEKHPEVQINCGSRACFKCRKCYKTDGTPFFINELIKKDQGTKRAKALGIG